MLFWFLIIISAGELIVGTFMLTQATAGVGAVGVACYLAILARIVQPKRS